MNASQQGWERARIVERKEEKKKSMASLSAVSVGVGVGIGSLGRRHSTHSKRYRKPSRVSCAATNGNGAPADLAKLIIPEGGYCERTWQSKRRPTRTIEIGKVKVGSDHPIALQTMTTADTRDVQKTVDEVMRVADAGADICRVTVQGMQEAKAAAEIRDELFKRGYDIPLVADIHFSPKVAMMVADCFEKVRGGGQKAVVFESTEKEKTRMRRERGSYTANLAWSFSF